MSKVFLITAESPSWTRYEARKTDAIAYARRSSKEDPANPIEVHVIPVRNELPKMELIARCLSRDNWSQGAGILVGRFLGGKPVRAMGEEIAA